MLTELLVLNFYESSIITIKKKLSKDAINALPLRYYEGPINLIDSFENADKACDNLARETILGFDTETKPSFKKGVSYSPSLLQLAGSDSVFLFRINLIGIPTKLKILLENSKIIKAGVAVNRDLSDIQKILKISPDNFVDIGEEAKRQRLENHGLRNLAALILNFRISKGNRISNWERNDLTFGQIRYAATDAWASREIYLKISIKK